MNIVASLITLLFLLGGVFSGVVIPVAARPLISGFDQRELGKLLCYLFVGAAYFWAGGWWGNLAGALGVYLGSYLCTRPIPQNPLIGFVAGRHAALLVVIGGGVFSMFYIF